MGPGDVTDERIEESTAQAFIRAWSDINNFK